MRRSLLTGERRIYFAFCRIRGVQSRHKKIVKVTVKVFRNRGGIEQYARFAAWRPGSVFAVFAFEKGEVVGNVHDNPDLLKAGGANRATDGQAKGW